jgi:hypothetical protein
MSTPLTQQQIKFFYTCWKPYNKMTNLSESSLLYKNNLEDMICFYYADVAEVKKQRDKKKKKA